MAEAIWEASDRLCSKRLQSFLPEMAQINDTLEKLWQLTDRPSSVNGLSDFYGNFAIRALTSSLSPCYTTVAKTWGEYPQLFDMLRAI